jgi:branched-chain amino acid transport system ATP-binding protein
VSVLDVRGVVKSFSGLQVIANLDFAVEVGERRLIIGPNGAGKTTLFNLITGEIAPDQGSVLLFGRDITRLPGWRRAHLGMTRTYQIITLFPDDSLLRNISLSLLGLMPLRWNPLVRLEKLEALTAAAREILTRVGLEHMENRPLRETAYGDQRRVEIGMALAQRPRLMLLDEPFAGLSVDERADIKDLLKSIPREVTIVMIEHDMDVALDFAERISLMHFGEMVVDGSRAEVVDHPRTREIYLGE